MSINPALNKNATLQILAVSSNLQMYPPPHVIRCQSSILVQPRSCRSRGIERCSARVFAFSFGILLGVGGSLPCGLLGGFGVV